MTPEGSLLRACLDLLAAEHILALRRNTGAIKTGNRFFRFGAVGMADIICFPRGWVLWIEAKSETGKQSLQQKCFQDLVTEHFHDYIVVRGSDDLLGWLRGHSTGKRLRSG